MQQVKKGERGSGNAAVSQGAKLGREEEIVCRMGFLIDRTVAIDLPSFSDDYNFLGDTQLRGILEVTKKPYFSV